MTSTLRTHFLLDPDVVFLNHGSFGACPKPVFDVYQNWQRELERQPVEFLGRRVDALLDAARAALADYIHAPAENLIFLTNATYAMNLVARSLDLMPDDEILTTDHEYGAVDMTWDFVTRRTGAKIMRHTVDLPVESQEAFVESFWQAVTPRTKIISISHITSPTALIFPIEAICKRAREAGIRTIIDGAHALGQIPLDMEASGADFYTSNAHKWLCAPKSAAFLYAREAHHDWLNPLVISWGWGYNDTFVGKNQWQGTQDVSSYLSVPAAVQFYKDHDWDTVRAQCHELARYARQKISGLTGITPVQADSPDWFAQMVAIPLPKCDPEEIKRKLYDDYKIEVPLTKIGDQDLIRISVQGYNTQADIDVLINALTELFDLTE